MHSSSGTPSLAYEPPKITKLGSVSDVTRGVGGSDADVVGMTLLTSP